MELEVYYNHNIDKEYITKEHEFFSKAGKFHIMSQVCHSPYTKVEINMAQSRYCLPLGAIEFTPVL
jgi:hypothetical protein